MGADKALLRPFPGNDRPLVEILASRLGSIFSRVVIVTRRPEQVPLGDVEVIADLPGLSDPLGALVTGLAHLSGGPVERAFCCAVDVPGLHLPLVRHLCDVAVASGEVLVAPEGPRGIEPLHAVYQVDAWRALRALHDSGLRRLQALRQHIGTLVVELSDLQQRGLLPPWALASVNTPEMLERFLAETHPSC